MENAERILELKGVTKSYSGVTVLHDMDFELHRGEIHCIVGENGAGKSTFIKVLSGAIRPDRGDIICFGQRCSIGSPQDSIKQGIATIYQDVDLVDTLTVADNIFLGDEVRRFANVVNKKEQVRRTRALLQSLSIRIDPAAMVEELSPAQKQTLQVVKALHRRARILIMDEPTASLGEKESESLMRLIKSLKQSGVSIIYISHYIDEVMEIADTVTVFKDGFKTARFDRADADEKKIIYAMVGREASQFYRRERVEPGEVCLEADGLMRLPAVRDVSFTLRRGEILGFGGLVGSGRSELVRLVFGADRMQGGALRVNGRSVVIKSPNDAIRNGICMLGENRKEDGLFLERSIMENICIAHNEKKLFLSVGKDRELANGIADKLGIRMRSVLQEVGYLSGGNQQKSILSRWLLTQCDIVIFDEPTKGVDVGAREEIYRLMVDLAKAGKAIIMVSSDMPEILSMSDRIAIMREGRLVGMVAPENLTEEKLLKMYLGLEGEL